METVRSFVSIKIPNVSSIGNTLEKLRGIKGVGVSKEVHLTLSFLGDVEMNKLNELSEGMRTLERYSAFKVSMKGLGAFPNLKDPRIVWIGAEPGEPFSKILSDLYVILDAAGIGYDKKPFKAHITVGRVREPSKGLTELLNEQKSLEFGSFVCSDIFLMKSVLTQKGAVHTVVDRFRLTE